MDGSTRTKGKGVVGPPSDGLGAVVSCQNPFYFSIKERTISAASADVAFEEHVKKFLAKKVEPSLARTDLLSERAPAAVTKNAQLTTSVYHEPYYVASSAGVGTLAARANSVDAGVEFCQQIKSAGSK
jgi:hypothetical protein